MKEKLRQEKSEPKKPDFLARAINLSNILDCDLDIENPLTPISLENEDISDPKPSTSTSKAEIESEPKNWRQYKLVEARQLKINTLGYYTKSGMEKEKAATRKPENGINTSNFDSSSSVSQQTSSGQVVKNNLLSNDSSMNAKNISKDRSASRGREGKKEKFGKQREESMDREEKMEQDEDIGGEKNGPEGKGTKGNGKRPRDPPKTGQHDNTIEDSDDDKIPGAKRNMQNIRERLTSMYEKKTKATRELRADTKTTPSVAFRVDKSSAGENIKTAKVPLLAPTKLSEAPVLQLKDLVPDQDKADLENQNQDETFKTDKIKFVLFEREVQPGENDAMLRSDREYEWEIAERETFDAVLGETIDIFTEEDWEFIDYLSYSSVGWNTGVGMFAFGSDKLMHMEKFRSIIRRIKRGNKRFESYPKRMLLNRYALTIYFNSAFSFSSGPKLLSFFKKLNGFEGDLTIGDYNCPELYSSIMRNTSIQVKLQSLTADSFISLS